jgi:hypothetical protein
VLALSAAGLFAVGLPAVGTAQAGPTATASVSVLHAVPGATVDVYANGKALLTDFKPGTLTDPVKLPAGKYDLKVTAAGAGSDVPLWMIGVLGLAAVGVVAAGTRVVRADARP